MKSLLDHVEHLKKKPHHIRRKVAVAVAGGISGGIALIWLVASLASGSFAVPNTSFADLYTQRPTVATTSPGDTSGLAGAAASVDAQKAPAPIEIVDTSSNASSSDTPEQTTIPF